MLLEAVANAPSPVTALQKHVVSISGGVDSTALLLTAMEDLGGDFLPVFADTGNEHEITLEYVSRLPERTGCPPVLWVKADFNQRLDHRRSFIPDNYEPEKALEALEALEAAREDMSPFFALCLWKGMFPCNVKRFCTVELKHIPIARYAYAPLLDEGHEVISWQGIRADESADRAKAKWIEPLGDGVIAYRPLLYRSKQDCFDILRRHGLEPNPLYSLGMSRVGCMPCLMARKGEIAQIALRFPEHIEKIRRWEMWVRRASKQGKSTFFPCTKVPGTSDMRASIDNVVAWAQCKTPGQMELDYERHIPACASVYGLCE